MDHLDNDLLTEIKLQDNVVASQGKRFANYIIDLILFYILAVGFGVVLAIASPETLANLDDDSLNTSLIDRIVTLFVYGTIMGLIEGFTKGKTLGKLITGTKAVNLDGSKITFQTGFFRGMCRAVPFNAFSALGTPSNPWHDRWNNTLVIDEKASNYQK